LISLTEASFGEYNPERFKDESETGGKAAGRCMDIDKAQKTF
jgi:hypothetical protein